MACPATLNRFTFFLHPRSECFILWHTVHHSFEKKLNCVPLRHLLHEEQRGVLNEAKHKMGADARTDVISFADMIDFDEGRLL